MVNAIKFVIPAGTAGIQCMDGSAHATMASMSG